MPFKDSEQRRAWKSAYDKTPDRQRAARDRWLQSEYGITIQDFERMEREQNFRCKICDKCKSLCVDHDHKTHEVRGLLCKFCNHRVGWFEKYRDIIEAYLDGSI